MADDDTELGEPTQRIAAGLCPEEGHVVDRFGYCACDRARAESDEEGFVKVRPLP